jgi:hypothetical protein
MRAITVRDLLFRRRSSRSRSSAQDYDRFNKVSEDARRGSPSMHAIAQPVGFLQ